LSPPPRGLGKPYALAYVIQARMEPARRFRPDRWVTIPDQSSAPFNEIAPRRAAFPCRTLGAGMCCVRPSPLVVAHSSGAASEIGAGVN
jgi:hypothetical protein